MKTPLTDTQALRADRYYLAGVRIAAWVGTMKLPSPPPALYSLLGYSTKEHCFLNMTEDDANTCRKLLGPHGLTVLKMLQARRNK